MRTRRHRYLRLQSLVRLVCDNSLAQSDHELRGGQPSPSGFGETSRPSSPELHASGADGSGVGTISATGWSSQRECRRTNPTAMEPLRVRRRSDPDDTATVGCQHLLRSFTLSQLRTEIGIRAALGANAGHLLRSIFTRAMGSPGCSPPSAQHAAACVRAHRGAPCRITP